MVVIRLWDSRGGSKQIPNIKMLCIEPTNIAPDVALMVAFAGKDVYWGFVYLLSHLDHDQSHAIRKNIAVFGTKGPVWHRIWQL